MSCHAPGPGLLGRHNGITSEEIIQSDVLSAMLSLICSVKHKSQLAGLQVIAGLALTSEAAAQRLLTPEVLQVPTHAPVITYRCELLPLRLSRALYITRATCWIATETHFIIMVTGDVASEAPAGGSSDYLHVLPLQILQNES